MKNKQTFSEYPPLNLRGCFAKIRSLRFMLVMLMAFLGVNVAFGAEPADTYYEFTEAKAANSTVAPLQGEMANVITVGTQTVASTSCKYAGTTYTFGLKLGNTLAKGATLTINASESNPAHVFVIGVGGGKDVYLEYSGTKQSTKYMYANNSPYPAGIVELVTTKNGLHNLYASGDVFCCRIVVLYEKNDNALADFRSEDAMAIAESTTFTKASTELLYFKPMEVLVENGVFAFAGGVSGIRKTIYFTSKLTGKLTVKAQNVGTSDRKFSVYPVKSDGKTLDTALGTKDLAKKNGSTINQQTIEVDVTKGTTYAIGANGADVQVLSISLKSAGSEAPSITTQPTGATYEQNATAEAMIVAASGIPTPTYQWYSNATNSNEGGTLIPDVTSAEYTPSTATVGTTYYYCVATNSKGSVASDVAAVTVTAPVTKYAVNFAAGDGTGSMDEKQYTENEVVTLPACGFTAPGGKEFDTWNDGAADYAVGASYTMPGHDVTFTAKWKDLPAAPTDIFKMTVTKGYTTNLATGATHDITDTEADITGTIGGTALVYNGKSSAVALMGSTNINLGGSSASYLKITLANGETLRKGDMIIISTANTFKLSETNSNSTTVSTASDGTYTVTASDILIGSNTLYVWKSGGSSFTTMTISRPANSEPNHFWDVTFDMNGATSTPIAKQSIFNGKKAIKPADPTKDGSDFVNWIVKDSDPEDVYDFNAAVTADVALIAKWNAAAAKFTVKYMDGTTELGTEEVVVGEHPTADGITTAKTCYTFNGWTPALDAVSGTAGETVTINAGYTANYATTADFAAEAAGSKTAINTFLSGKNYVASVSTANSAAYDTNTAGYNGFKFKNLNDQIEFLVKQGSRAYIYIMYSETGWDIYEDNVVKYSNVTEKSKTANLCVIKECGSDTKDVLVKLVNKSANTKTSVINKIVIGTPVTVTFNANGGSAVAAQNIMAGEKATKPADPTKDGFGFVEWQKDGVAFDFATAISENTTLVARWAAKHTISYANTKTADVTALPKFYLEGVGVATIPALANIDGYNFKNWDVTSIGTDATEDVTITADWESTCSTNNEIISFTYGETTVTATEGKRDYAIELPYRTAVPAALTYESEAASKGEVAKNDNIFSFTVTSECGEVANYTVTFTVAPKDGIAIIDAALTSNTAATVTGLIGGTADVNVTSGSYKMDLGKYIGVTLANGNFQAGDVVALNVSDKQGATGFTLYTDKGSSLIVDTRDGNAISEGVHYITLPENFASNTIYVGRFGVKEETANLNACIDNVKVLRPMAPVLTGATILGEAAAVNEAAKTVTIEVPFSTDVTAIEPDFEFVSNDNEQVVVTPTGAQDFTEAKTYRFTDKDGDYTEYVVSITKAEASHDATLSGITVGGIALDGFVAENTSYTYVREYGDDVIPAVEGQKNHTGATVASTTEGNVVTLTVTAEDKTTQKIYTITFDNKPQPAAVPTITIQPASHDYIDTEVIAALTVGASTTDAGVLSYQWYKGEELVGDNLPTYIPTEAGSYKVVVTNTLGTETATATSDVAVITVRHIYTFNDWTEGATFTKAGEWTMYPYNKDNRWLTEDVKFSANQRIDDSDAAKKANVFTDQYFVVKFEKDVEEIVIANYYTGSDRYINEISTLVPGNPELGDKGKGTATPITSDFDITYTGRSSSPAKVTTTTITKKADSEKLFEKDIYYVFKMSGTSNAIYDFIVTAAPEQMAAPAVNTGLAGETICAEDNFATLSAVTADEATYSYQWFKDEAEFATTMAITPTEGGEYFCRVTNHADGYRDNVAETEKVTLVRLTNGTEITDHSETNVRLEEGQSATLSVTATGKGEISYAWFTCDDAEGTNPVVIENEDEPTYQADFAAGVQYIMAQVSGDCGTTSIVFIVSEKIDLPQRDVTASTTWDWAAFAGGTQNIAFANQTDEFLFANVSALVPNNTTFPSDQLVGKGQWVWRIGETHFQGRKLSFHTTIGGKVKVNYRSTGSGETVSVTINGMDAGSHKNTYEYSKEIFVQPGDVVIEFGGDKDTRINKVVFTSIKDMEDKEFDYVRDCGLGAMTTTCLPKNVPAGCFTGATFYETAYFTRGGDGLPYKVFFDEVTELKAGYPYLVVMDEGETTFRVLYGEEEEATPQVKNGFHGVYTTFRDGEAGADGNILENNYIVVNNQIRLCGARCGLNDNRAWLKLNDEADAVSTTDPAPAGAARRRVSLGGTSTSTPTALDGLTEEGQTLATKVLYDGRIIVLRGGKMYGIDGKSLK